METKLVDLTKQFALDLPFVKSHAGDWTAGDFLKVAGEVAVHVKNLDISSNDVVKVVVDAVLFVVDEVVKSDLEKSKNLKELVEKQIHELLSAKSFVENGLVLFLKKLFYQDIVCCGPSSVSVAEEVKAEPVVEKAEPVVEPVVEKVAEKVVEVKAEPVVEKVAEPVVEKVVEKKFSALDIYKARK